ncbi:hypothetical protein RHSIM_Rhsim09G0176000 [Rhododendron simsii]|uniref:CCHC-type domain-containing protein n=1 Tax=Rhododendron simsii TaxID=118357 RepID=A0A834GGY3_RHOSS|nr:hypothetical protein RHSIM_Rhsim09G0176000 [Rhododendron simsii]
MPPRRQRNVEDVTLRDQIAELRQSNQALQQMMNELLQRIPVTKQSTFQSEGSGRTIFNNEEEDDHSTSSTSNTVAEPAFVNPCSLEEAYQMALKAEEKLKWGSYREPESLKNVKDKAEKVAAPTFESPEAQGGGNKDPRKGMSSSNRCFRCGEPGHRSYECPKKKAELNLMEEESDEPIYHEESGGLFEEEVSIPNFNAECLLIRHVMVTKEDIGDVWDGKGCGKNDVMTTECFKPPICDENLEDNVKLEKLKLQKSLLITKEFVSAKKRKKRKKRWGSVEDTKHLTVNWCQPVEYKTEVSEGNISKQVSAEEHLLGEVGCGDHDKVALAHTDIQSRRISPYGGSVVVDLEILEEGFNGGWRKASMATPVDVIQAEWMRCHVRSCRGLGDGEVFFVGRREGGVDIVVQKNVEILVRGF